MNGNFPPELHDILADEQGRVQFNRAMQSHGVEKHYITLSDGRRFTIRNAFHLGPKNRTHLSISACGS